jgi:aminoglycoside 3-N-acetyltransferase
MIQELASEWKKAGVKEGDVILVHSDIKRTFKRYLNLGVKFTSQDILWSFLSAIGKSGTLLLPLFNFDFTRGIPFDIRATPSCMGALTEAGRKHSLAVRTGHPIYSFAAIGFDVEKFRSINNYSGYGSDSPFAILRELNGKIAILDLPEQGSMTFYHHVEEMNRVPYRYHKEFTGKYIDQAGNAEIRSYGLFVRNIERKIITHGNPAGEMMWKEGIYSGYRPNEGCGLRIARSQYVYEFISKIIAVGKAENTLYRIEGKQYD